MIDLRGIIGLVLLKKRHDYVRNKKDYQTTLIDVKNVYQLVGYHLKTNGKKFNKDIDMFILSVLNAGWELYGLGFSQANMNQWQSRVNSLTQDTANKLGVSYKDLVDMFKPFVEYAYYLNKKGMLSSLTDVNDPYAKKAWAHYMALCAKYNASPICNQDKDIGERMEDFADDIGDMFDMDF